MLNHQINFVAIIVKAHIGEKWGMMMKKECANIAKKNIWQINTQKGNIVQSVGITKIEYLGKEDVYNMEVPFTHNFSVNGGVVVHNCMDAVRYFVKTMNLVRKNDRKVSEGAKQYL